MKKSVFILENQLISENDCCLQTAIFICFFKESEKLVPSEIKYYLGQNYEILVEIEEVDYFDTDFSRASHRLSLAEITEIVKYQSMGQCLKQLPEGIGKGEREYWENNYKRDR
ncbi:hypothetical protein RSSL_00760 [Streptococcus salivarius K12]|uniref:Uncharacterized protein n=1 Tax=Streptococcus salivarius K12 TaxID=1200793 RepID=J7SHT2_STRSL|nr:hypothetical protein RSSL_00760 [Streptococcus salivarius K12]